MKSADLRKAEAKGKNRKTKGTKESNRSTIKRLIFQLFQSLKSLINHNSNALCLRLFHITAVPIVAADGTKLKATFVKKGLTERSVRNCLKSDRLMCWSENGWVNNGVMLQIIEQVIVPHVRPPSRSCLIMDSFSAHQTECIRDKLDRINCELVIVPEGQTGKYQQLDVGVFSVIKKRCGKPLVGGTAWREGEHRQCHN